MRLRATALVIGIPIADRFAQSPQPVTSPGKFDAEYREADRDHYKCRTRRHYHNDAHHEHGSAYDSHNDASRRFVRKMNCSLHPGTCSAMFAFAVFCRSLGTMIKLLRLPCLLVAVLTPVAVLSTDGEPLTVHVQESTAKLAPGDETPREIRLPALDVAIVASLQCPASAKATSLVVSVSDTHQSYGPEVLADAVSLEAAFSVPARQLAPVVISEFCINGADPDDQGLRLHGVATAQVSMRCRDENDSTSLYFASVPIPVRLYCHPDGEPEASSTDR